MITLEFRQGVPDGCVKWLWDNIGPGNLKPVRGISSIQGYQQDHLDKDEYKWYYERIGKAITPQAFVDDPFEYVPTITVKDEKAALLFVLKWS